MSSDTTAPVKQRAPHLTPNARALLISYYNAGRELSDPNYYIIKNKDGKLNVRRKRVKSDTPVAQATHTDEEPKAQHREAEPVKPPAKGQPAKKERKTKPKAL